jgi:hypothetical protein
MSDIVDRRNFCARIAPAFVFTLVISEILLFSDGRTILVRAGRRPHSENGPSADAVTTQVRCQARILLKL